MVKPSQRGIAVGASASVGWINKLYILPGETNAFLSGYSGNFIGAYGVAGGGVAISPGIGSATVLGIGAGVSYGSSSNASAAGGSGVSFDMGKTGLEW